MTHASELEATIAAIRPGARHAALVALCRDVANQMDAAAGSPTNRLSAVYLSCLKDLARATTATKTSGSKLGQLRATHNHAV